MSIIRTNFRFLFPIATFSNFVALLVGLGLAVIMRLFQIGTVSFLFSAIMITSFLVQTYLFKVKKLTESQFIDSKWLKKKHKLIPRQLDQYCNFNYVGYSLMKIIVVATTIAGYEAHTSLSVAFLFFFGFLILKQIAASAKLVHLPTGLFVKCDRKEISSPYKGGIDYANQLATGITTYRNH